MKKENFYKVVIILLLLLNSGVIAYLLLQRGPGGRPPMHGGPDRMIIERLKLDGEQRQKFEGLKHEHHAQMLDIQEKSGEVHHKLFALLENDKIDSLSRA